VCQVLFLSELSRLIPLEPGLHIPCSFVRVQLSAKGAAPATISPFPYVSVAPATDKWSHSYYTKGNSEETLRVQRSLCFEREGPLSYMQDGGA
jgi:hypothetical protein